ncbi:ATP-binding protein [Candidatus Phytoplasma fraxini]|uniref:ATP-dependent Zn protease n=1 Tax=Ash yellows phytoplasma TaxID=35780 RepID=A0ABZ2U8E0_ASHYP
MQKEIKTKKLFKALTVISIILSLLFILLSSGTYVNWKTATNLQEESEKQKQQTANMQKKIKDISRTVESQRIQPMTNSGDSTSPHKPSSSVHQDNQYPNIFQPSQTSKFLSFDKIIGMKKEKEAMQEFMDYVKGLETATHNERLGTVEAPSGIILYGTAGTGKTMLARAIATETNLSFFEISSSIFSQKYKGVGKDMVIYLFEAARKEAKNSKGAIIFLDECETIFGNLGNLKEESETSNIVNQFKTELTSTENDEKHPVFVIGATNHFNKLDEAIKSRFDYKLEVKVGNFQDRKEFLNFMINKRKNPYSAEAKHYLTEDINGTLDKKKLMTK